VTDPQGDLQVREYHGANGVADPGHTVVIEVPKQSGFSNHNGGWIGFSPVDDCLYVATGDGGSGSGGDLWNHAQNRDVLLGKMLRLDVNSDDFPDDTNRNYRVPATNPFVGVDGADEIWAYSLRNPYRAALDPRNGDRYIGDVGQSQREVVGYLPAGLGGANFGWGIMEGELPFNPGGPGAPQPADPSLRLPLFSYGRGLGSVITGGQGYVGPNANFQGQYVFSDFGSGNLWSLSVENGTAVDVTLLNSQLRGFEGSSMPGLIVEFVTFSDGHMYAV
jgi:hypothetical protein